MMKITNGWQAALAVLEPLNAEIDAALAAGDVASAMRLAFGRAAEAAALVSDEPQAAGMAGVDGVLVELTPLPLSVFEDGTLRENGAYVSLAYRHWVVTPQEAEFLAGEFGGASHWPVFSP